MTSRRDVFILTLRPEPPGPGRCGCEPVQRLRSALKTLRRRFGLKCVSALTENKQPVGLAVESKRFSQWYGMLLADCQVVVYPVSVNITEQLRRAIETSGMSRFQLARLSGVSEAALSRFMSGKRSIGLDSVDKLAVVLKLRLVIPKRK